MNRILQRISREEKTKTQVKSTDQIVDGRTIFLDIKVSWTSLLEFENALPDRRMKKPDTNSRTMTLATGLDSLQIMSDLNKPSESLDETRQQVLNGKPTRTRDNFSNTRRSLREVSKEAMFRPRG